MANLDLDFFGAALFGVVIGWFGRIGRPRQPGYSGEPG